MAGPQGCTDGPVLHTFPTNIPLTYSSILYAVILSRTMKRIPLLFWAAVGGGGFEPFSEAVRVPRFVGGPTLTGGRAPAAATGGAAAAASTRTGDAQRSPQL